MKKLIRTLSLRAVLLVTPLFFTVNVHAQNWSEEEQGLLDFLEMSWDAWMEAIKKNDPDVWLKKANPVEGFSYWWSREYSPRGERTLRRNWDAVRNSDLGWVDFRPVRIQIRGNVGVIHFYGYWKAKTNDGPVTTEHMRTEVFLKEDGKWRFFSGHSTPTSSSSSDPYKER